MVHSYSYLFYIRALSSETLREEIKKKTDWKTVKIGDEDWEVTSLMSNHFMPECHYRLVVQRQKRKNGELDIFDGEYMYRSILTNDWNSSEEDIVAYYNKRGGTERTFDMLNNDFGWSHLPCSKQEQNTVFLLLTAMAMNFYLYVRVWASKIIPEVNPKGRIKQFVFNFISVVGKWSHSGRQDVLHLYTNKRYDKLWKLAS